jgi:voltage-gated potassium channel
MASFAMQPHVAEFLDVVMHDDALEFRMEQVEVADQSPLADRTLFEAAVGETTGVLLLAIRSSATGPFLANPTAETRLAPGSILIAVGTPAQLDKLRAHAATR